MAIIVVVNGKDLWRYPGTTSKFDTKACWARIRAQEAHCVSAACFNLGDTVVSCMQHMEKDLEVRKLHSGAR